MSQTLAFTTTVILIVVVVVAEEKKAREKKKKIRRDVRWMEGQGRPAVSANETNRSHFYCSFSLVFLAETRIM